MLRNVPIKRKILVSIVGTMIVMITLVGSVFVFYSWLSDRDTASRNLDSIASMFSLNTAAALSFADAGAANELLSSLRGMPEIRRACLYLESVESGASSGLFASYIRGANIAPCPRQEGQLNAAQTQSLRVHRAVELDRERLGSLVIERSLADLQTSRRVDALVLLIMLVGSVAVATLVSNGMQGAIAAPLLSLLGTIRRVSAHGDYKLRAERHGSDEVGELIDGFNVMLSSIATRDADLARAREELVLRIAETDAANTELRSVVEDLHRTQKQLVATEKMASLGELVAGVAHEINTPVGVGVTAASTLYGASRDTADAYKAGALTDGGLRRYFEQSMQSTTIILNNLRRAADLVNSFKRVAVDQTSFERRRFHLRSYLEETLLSLRPNLKNTEIAVEIDCEATLEVDSVPGAISQIITNLVMNSLSHAFAPGQAGSIVIKADALGEEIRLSYRDDGCGMDSEIREKIFEPFYTTKRGQGGSGLGMHIVFNLVTQQLGGRVEVVSSPDAGTEVCICFPAQQC